MVNNKARFGIAARLYALAVFLCLSLGGVALVAYFKLARVDQTAEITQSMRVPQLTRIAAVELNITRVSLQLRHAMLARSPAEMQGALDDISAKRQEIDKLLRAYEGDLSTSGGSAGFDKLAEPLSRFWLAGMANLDLIKAGQKDEAFAFLVDRTIPARNEVLALLADTVLQQQSALHHDIEGMQDETRITWRLVVGLATLSLVILLVFSIHVARLLKRRVQQAQQLTERVRDGDLAHPELDRELDEFSPLLAALDEMRLALTQLVGGVRGNAERVSGASSEIAQGNLDLSSRTEEQASALQQTAATMDVLSHTVRHNADSAQQAKQLSINASMVAEQGGDVVGQVVSTMKDINESSRKISDIIAVIDGIAFQTNILALNAAVEAARAGEQGRGFAVVASEVRALAQRSAGAAKEIKTLISASVEQVEQGSDLVDQAGQTMGEIVSAIKRVADIVGEISAASQEQSRGVAQVNEAITQMDKTTQQNAALVEQSAAAAESLEGQANELVQAMAVFKLQT
ncbi:methyl-accepting chemotaxis protein [Paucibacter aquatile]|uniref:Methyl-accepting chemotaxis protein n=1 Tax=Kinneretia aquatilis TaxID=2070761 RepID=A0A2N8KV16_9BURK|nr:MULTISPECIES: methyl-accepting chemotaxis protein [Roseateles]PND37309.1 methyl-accepting chemotaxis protein [Paucibacter aquatile]WIV96281.1 methyl-accepting chemotaxis protein [Paucibacter aquatile]